MNYKHNRAFTLVELVIVMTIIIVISAIAIPSYRDYVLRSARTEAMTALEELSNRQEEYFSDQRAYTGTIADLNYSITTPGNYYQLGITTNPTVGYDLEATAIGPQLKDGTCQTFTLNGLGSRGAKDVDASDTTAQCWNR